jgi:catechol 2,3-dioxygenase-like lactoylglutathione lyase family enzyme
MAAITTHKGFSHIGLATRDLEATRKFYEGVLGFKLMIADIISVEEGGQVRHMFFDTGRDQLLAFMEAKGIDGIPNNYDTSINGACGLPSSFFHFAFEGGSAEAMKAIHRNLTAKGVQVSDIIDHGASHSMYFKDPVNGLSLEYCAWVRPFTEEGATMQQRYRMPASKFGDWERINAGNIEEFAGRFK